MCYILINNNHSQLKGMHVYNVHRSYFMWFGMSLTYPFKEEVHCAKEADCLSSKTKVIRWHMLNRKRWLQMKYKGSVEMQQWKMRLLK